MHTAPSAPTATFSPAAYERSSEGILGTVTRLLAECRDWLDARGRLAWIAAMVLGFIACWPVGLFILGYMIWSKRMFGNCSHRRHRSDNARFYRAASTGNVAFDAYRDETLKRLENEHQAFVDYLEKLREAKDKAEFDRFMEERQSA